MSLEAPGRRQLNGDLPYSDTAVSTHFTGMYHGAFQIDDKTIPASMTINNHIFSVPGLYIGMHDAVDMIGEKIEDPVLEEAVAVSGLKEHLASMTPQPGGSILNRELNAQFLTPTVDLKPFYPMSGRYYGHPESRRAPLWPSVDLAVHYGRATVSVFDFPRMVSYAVRNTALQHTINQSNMGRPPIEIDPRLALLKATAPAAAA